MISPTAQSLDVYIVDDCAEVHIRRWDRDGRDWQEGRENSHGY